MNALENYLQASYSQKSTPPRAEEQIGNLLHQVFDRMAYCSLRSENPAFTTGFEWLDDRVGGLEPGELITVSSASGSGTTAFLLGLALNIAKTTDRPILYFTTQQPAHQLARRMLSIVTRVSLCDMERGAMREAQWEALTLGSKFLSQKDIRIYDKVRENSEICKICREAVEPALIILDTPPMDTDVPYETLKELAQQKQAVVMVAGWLPEQADYNIHMIDKSFWMDRLNINRLQVSPVEALCVVERNVHGSVGKAEMWWDDLTASFFYSLEEKMAVRDERR